MPDLGIGSLSGPLQVLAGTSAVADSTTLLTAFGTKAKVLATSSGGQLELDPDGTFGGIVMHTPVLFGETAQPTSAATQGWIWVDSTSTKLTFLNGATVGNAMTLDSSGNVNVAGTYQIAGTSIFATASTWSALQTFSAGLTVSGGTITFDTVPVSNVGGSVTLVGYGAGALANTSALDNCAFGHNALGTNGTPGDNCAFGSDSLFACSGGSGGNSAYGIQSLGSLTTGSYNVAVGGYAASNGTVTGQFNIAIGYQSMLAITSGSNNIAFGYLALSSNTTGTRNLAVGELALSGYNNTTSATGNNVAFGVSAGGNYTGSEIGNTIIGTSVLGTAGESNTLRIGNPNTTLLLGSMTGVTTTDYLSIAGMIATANGGTAPTAVTVPASGTAYTPSTTVNTVLTVSGGTVSAIAINGISVGLTSGTFYMKKSDTITFTYTAAPTVYQMTA